MPATRASPALWGSPEPVTLTLLNWIVPVNSWEISSPTTGSAKSTISVQTPGRVQRVGRERGARSATHHVVLPIAERVAVGADEVGANGVARVVGERHLGADVVHRSVDVELVVVRLTFTGRPTIAPVSNPPKERPLITPLKKPRPPLTRTRLRSVTGIEVLALPPDEEPLPPPNHVPGPPQVELSTIEPEASLATTA